MRIASVASITVAFALIALKMWAWLSTDSIALLSSLVDSALDLAASFITFLAVRVAVSPADREHRFGHGKSEGVASLVQALIVGASALFVGAQALARLVEPRPIERPAVGMAVMALSLVISIALVAFQRYVAKRTASLAVSADAMHYTADILTNLAVLGAIFLSSRFGWQWIDPLLGLLIAVLILYGVRATARQALDMLLDRELPSEDRRRVEAIAADHPEVLGVHDVRTRSAGLSQFIQLHLELDPSLTLSEVHEISGAIEADLRRHFPRAEILIRADAYGAADSRDAF
jgi:ferrous-iron efflux pump FieF